MYFRRLRDLREDRDLKQTDVAALLGIRQTVYSRYERGYQNPQYQSITTERNHPVGGFLLS